MSYAFCLYPCNFWMEALVGIWNGRAVALWQPAVRTMQSALLAATKPLPAMVLLIYCTWAQRTPCSMAPRHSDCVAVLRSLRHLQQSPGVHRDLMSVCQDPGSSQGNFSTKGTPSLLGPLFLLHPSENKKATECTTLTQYSLRIQKSKA